MSIASGLKERPMQETTKEMIQRINQIDPALVSILFSQIPLTWKVSFKKQAINFILLEKIVFHIFLNVKNKSYFGKVTEERYGELFDKDRGWAYMNVHRMVRAGLLTISHTWNEEQGKYNPNTYDLGPELEKQIRKVLPRITKTGELKRTYPPKFTTSPTTSETYGVEEWVHEQEYLDFALVGRLFGLIPNDKRKQLLKLRIPLYFIQGMLFDTLLDIRFRKRSDIGIARTSQKNRAERYGVTQRTISTWDGVLQKEGLFSYKQQHINGHFQFRKTMLGPVLRQWLIAIIYGQQDKQQRESASCSFYFEDVPDSFYNLNSTYNKSLELKEEENEVISRKEVIRNFFKKKFRDSRPKGVAIPFHIQFKRFDNLNMDELRHMHKRIQRTFYKYRGIFHKGGVFKRQDRTIFNSIHYLNYFKTIEGVFLAQQGM